MSHEHHISLQPCSCNHFASCMNRQLDRICMYEMEQTRMHTHVYMVYNICCPTYMLGVAYLVCFVCFNCTMYHLLCYIHGLESKILFFF